MSRLNLGAITAYAIAVKHGFEGTEEEWLASLKCEIDSELSETSENPLQNKVITKALDEKVDKVKEEVEVEVEEVKNKAEIALNNAVKAEQTAKEYADEKAQTAIITAQSLAKEYTDQKSATHAKLNADNTFTQKNEFTGSLTIPNSPDNPETAKVTDTYTTRETAKADTTGLTVVDGSATLIEEIKGSTVRCENLLPYPYKETTKTENGLTFTVNSDGSITINGQPTAYVGLFLTDNFKLKPSTTYTLSFGLPSTLREANIACDFTFFDNTNAIVRTFELKDAPQYTFTTQENEYQLRIAVKRMANNVATNTVVYPMFNEGETALPYQPYFTDLKNAQISGIKSSGKNLIEGDIYNLPKTLELGEWDSFNPQAGEIARATKTLVLNGTENWYIGGTNTTSSTGERRMALGGGGVYRHTSSATAGNIKCNNYNTYSADAVYVKKEGISTYNGEISFYDSNFNTDDISLWKAHLAELYAAGTPLIISYELATPTIEKLENVPNSYTVYDGGTETILGNENEEYGTKLTVTQTYSIHENPNEAAKKAYVQNGLAKKLDKTGGTITGHLIVENGTTTTVPSLAVKNNENTYGLVLEDDTYKLGKGTVDEKGNFKLDDGEGLPIALRDDSSLFANEELLMWSSNGNKIVSTGITLSQLISKIDRLE